MRLHGANVLVTAALAVYALAVVPPVDAADYPDKPIKIVVAYPAGGATDVITRLIGQRLGERLKQSVVVENRPGASGMIGSEYVAKSPPDGYTLIYTAADTHSINPHVYPKIAYDARRDFTPVALAGYNPFALIVKTTLPVTTVAQFVAMAKEQPGKLTFASWGVGSSGQAGMEMFNGYSQDQPVARAVSGRGARDRGSHGRASGFDDGSAHARRAEQSRRQGADPRGRHAETVRRCAGRADARRAGRAVDRRALAGTARAGQHAARGRRRC